MQSKPTTATAITIASSHCEPHSRTNRVAPTGYAFSLSTGVAEPHWGFGGARETQEMLAQGLIRAAELAFLDDDEATIEVIVRKIGFQKYLTEFLPLWRPRMANDRSFSRNNIQVWKRLHDLSLLGRLTIRLPTTAAETELVEDMQQLAKEAASKALADLQQNRSKYSKAGVFATDEDQTAPEAS
ncbi:UNVERIFIED_ORG: hypothetical protein M2425_005844 [Bradyrhizobium japonicum]